MPNYPVNYGNVVIGGSGKPISIASAGSNYNGQVLTVSNGTGATEIGRAHV